MNGKQEDLTEGQPPAGDLEATEFKALEDIAAGDEPEAGTAESGEAGQQAETLASSEESLSGLLELIFIPAEQFGMRRTAKIWTKEECDKVAARAVPVLRKYPWGQSFLRFLDDGLGMEEMALLMVLAPLVKRTVSAVRDDVADLKAEAEQPPKADA